MKRFFMFTIIILSFTVISCYAAPADDWSLTYSDTNKITGLLASAGTSDYTGSSVVKGTGTVDGRKVLNAGATFNNMYLIFDNILFAVNYGNNYLYMYDTYHYTVSFSVKTRIYNNAGATGFYGQNYKFVLCSALQAGEGVGNYFVSNMIAPSSSYVDGDYTYYIFDFDLSAGKDWPSALVSNNKVLFTGFGVVNTGGSLFGTYNARIDFRNVSVRAYSPDEWQAYITEQGFDNISNEVVEGMKEYSEWERQEGESTGNSAVSDLTDALPDNSAGLLSSFQNLFTALGYSGTDCSWPFPAIKLPAIPGVMDERILSEATIIDFSVWIDKIPEPVLLIVRALTTCALVLFCFKELWSLVQYVMTLKGGSELNG